MTTRTTAAQALVQARAIKTSRSQQHYQAQVATYRPAAQTAFQTVIAPWWEAFAISPQAAQIRRWLASENRPRVAIADPVQYIGPKGAKWEATVMLELLDRRLRLTVQQLRDGRAVSSVAGALLAHHMRRTIPPAVDGLCQLDLHPIVLIDFAEQLAGHTVQAHITAIVSAR